MKEGELKRLPNGAPVYAVYDHPNPSDCFRGVVYVEHEKLEGEGYADAFCYLNVGGPDSSFSFDYTFGEDDRTDESFCLSGSEEEGDGDTLTLFHVREMKHPKKAK